MDIDKQIQEYKTELRLLENWFYINREKGKAYHARYNARVRKYREIEKKLKELEAEKQRANKSLVSKLKNIFGGKK